MVRKLTLINVLIVLMTSIDAIYFVNDSQRAKTSRFQKFVNKCCSIDHYVGRKRVCVEFNDTLNFSDVKVYDKALNSTGKSLKEVFTLTTKKFNDKTFKKDSLDVTLMDFNIYLTESGVLELEVPNAYNRWFAIAPGNYCVDYHVADPSRITPRFWAILPDEEFNESSLYTICATFVSCFFLLLVLVVYILLPDLQNLSGKIVMATVGNLFVAYLLMSVIQIKKLSRESCIGLTLVTYFFLLASFFWINVMSYDIATCFTILKWSENRLQLQRKMMMYCLYAWGVPLLMTIGLAVINTVDMRHWPWFVTPRIPEYGCFLQGGVKLMYLYVPMLILTVCNWVFYIKTVYTIYKIRKAVSRTHNTIRTSSVVIFRKLSILMGLNWLLEVVNFMYPGLKLWYLSDAYNLLIGLVLFIMFVCKKSIWNQLCELYWINTNYNWPRFLLFSNTSTTLDPIRFIPASSQVFTLHS